MEQIQEDTPEEGVVIPRGFLGTRRQLIAAGVISAISVTRFSPYIFDVEARDRIREPFDVVDHIGNLSVTYALTSVLAVQYWGNRWRLQSPEEFGRRRRIMAALGATVAVAANFYAEKFGYGEFSTPDSWDVVYGLAGGYIGWKTEEARYASPAIVRDIEHHAPDSAFANEVRRLRKEKYGDYPNAEISPGKRATSARPKTKNRAARKRKKHARKRNRS